MGLLAYVYRNNLGDCTANGITSKAEKVCVVNIDGPFSPSPDAPAVELVEGNLRGLVKAIPAGVERHAVMSGGNFIGTSDSRFSRKIEEITGRTFAEGIVPMHDRIEW